jgi:hypothetical protein
MDDRFQVSASAWVIEDDSSERTAIDLTVFEDGITESRYDLIESLATSLDHVTSKLVGIDDDGTECLEIFPNERLP